MMATLNNKLNAIIRNFTSSVGLLSIPIIFAGLSFVSRLRRSRWLIRQPGPQLACIAGLASRLLVPVLRRASLPEMVGTSL